MMAIGMVVEIEKFPTMPAFPGCPLVEEHGSSRLTDDCDEGDGGDDEDEEDIE